MNVADLLDVNVSEFKEPPKFPAGFYTMAISDYSMIPFSWKNKGIFGLSYVPTFNCVSSIEADDDSNPELQEEQLAALNLFGDWTKRDFKYTYKEKESGKTMDGFSKVNFTLILTDETHEEALGLFDEQLHWFYLNKDGEESGFVVDVLGLSFSEGAPIKEVMEATVGRQFIAQMVYEPSGDPQYPDRLVVESVTCA